MARELVQCTLPHRDPGDVEVWTRKNRTLTLVMQRGHDGEKAIMFGHPSGSIPRLPMFWPTGECLRNLAAYSDEAKRLKAASRKQINDTRLLKRQRMEALSVWITKHNLKQAAAGILMAPRPRVSDVVNKKTAKFTIDTLVEMLSRAGKPVRLTIG